MKKLISISVFLIVVGAAMYGFYRTFDKHHDAPAIALKAIPQSAALIFETHQAGELWRDLSISNLMWDELKATDYFYRMDVLAKTLDSLLANQKELRKYIADKEIALSAHVSGSRDFHFILSLQLEPSAVPNQVVQSLATLLRAKEEVQTRTYDGVTIFTITPGIANDKLFFTIHEGLLVMSLSAILVEESIRALQHDASVLTHPDFVLVRKTKARDSRGELYVNYRNFKNIVSQFAAKEHRSASFFNQPYAEWSALDLNLKSNSVSLNGFVMAKDSTDAWIGSFRGLSAPRMNLLKYMPSNTAYFAFFGFDNFKKFRKNQMEIYARSNQKYFVESKIKEYNNLCKCDMEELGMEWIGSQAAAFIVEPETADYSQNYFAVFETQQVKKAWEALISMQEARMAVLNQEPAIEQFGDFEIRRLEIGTFYGKILSEAFEGIVDPYIVKLDNVILMSTSLNALRNLLQKIGDSSGVQNTLAAQEDFKQISDRISGNSHLLIYSALARSPQIYQNLLLDSYARDLQEQTDVLRKFQAFVYQVNYHKRDLYYNNIYFKYNPEYKKESNSLWEYKLKTDVSSRPHLLKNHYTQALEVFIQDNDNRIYLISNTGKLLWDLPIDGPIMSDVTQVDVYRNNKLQILFSTEKSIYLIDRNGNNVESFPVRLSANATNGVTAVDYDKSRHYRFFIAVKGGEVFAYEPSGKKVDGWSFKDNEGDIVSDIEHIRIKSKDYIFAFNEKGKIHLLNRRGENRHSVYQHISQPAAGQWSLDLKSKIAESGLKYIDEDGNAYRQGFDERFTKIKLTDKKILGYNFPGATVSGSIWAVVLTPDKLEAYTSKGDIVFSTKLKKSENHRLQTFIFPEGKVRFGVSDPDGEQILLYDRKGNLRSGFPLYGHNPMAISDLNRDGYFNLITSGKDGFVYSYGIE